MSELEELKLHDYFSENGDPIVETQQGFPRLKRLETVHTYFAWSSPIYWSLRSLKLNNPSVRPTVDELLHVLRGCTALEALELHEAFPHSAAADGLRGTVPLRLPALRHLNMQGHHSEVSSFLILIEVPQSCNIDVHYTILDSDNGSLDPILAVVPTQPLFRFLVRQSTILSLVVNNQAVDLFALSSTGTHAHGPHLSNRITGHFGDDSRDITPNWKALIDTFASAPLVHLALVHDSLPRLTSEMWQTCFSRFPQLESVTVGPLRTGNLHTFETVLATLLESNALEAGPYCPRLRAVGFVGMVIDPPGADALLALLEARASRRAPLEQLCFSGTFCTKEVDALALKERITTWVKLNSRYASGCGCCGGHEDCEDFRYLPEPESAERLVLEDEAEA
ncbi:hypothetical protein C8Q76DRAFT_801813 [Earliella scabrosa]|nr:hypothetical protein C8Q76DRAFT_801813 [Earliella scabrosa]